MTPLRKRVSRRTVEAHNWQGRRLVVTLYPGDVLEFREERCRKVFSASIKDVFQTVVKWNVATARAERRKRKKGKRNG